MVQPDCTFKLIEFKTEIGTEMYLIKFVFFFLKEKKKKKKKKKMEKKNLKNGKRQCGRVLKLFTDKNFGFIQRDVGVEDIFFHFSEYPAQTSDDIQPGTLVEFNVAPPLKGDRLRAINITILTIPNPKHTATISHSDNIKEEPPLGCFKVIESDVTHQTLFIPVMPIDGDYSLSPPILRYA